MFERLQARLFARSLPLAGELLLNNERAIMLAASILSGKLLARGHSRDSVVTFVHAVLSGYLDACAASQKRPHWVHALDPENECFWRMMRILPEPRSSSAIVLRTLERLHADTNVRHDVRKKALVIAIDRCGDHIRLIESASMPETREAAWLLIEPHKGVPLALHVLERPLIPLERMEEAIRALSHPRLFPTAITLRRKVRETFDLTIRRPHSLGIRYQLCAMFLKLLPYDYEVIAEGIRAIFGRARLEILQEPYLLVKLLQHRIQTDPMGFALAGSILLQKLATDKERKEIIAGAIYVRKRSKHPASPLVVLANGLLNAETSEFWRENYVSLRFTLILRFQLPKPGLNGPEIAQQSDFAL